MSFHVIAYTANTFGVTNFSAAPVSDNWIGIQNSHFFPQRDLKLFGGWFGNVNLTKVTLVTPQSRRVVPPVLYPIQQAANPPDRPHIWDRRTNPFTLRAIEEIDLQINMGGAANAIFTGILFVGDVLTPVPAGDIFSLHFTSTTAAVANTWTTITMTPDQTIPSGSYAVVGSQHQSATAVAHRINFRDPVMRPGFLSLTSLGNITDPSYYQGGWGTLGTFNTTAYPFMDVYCTAADAAHDIVLNMIKVG